MTVAEAAALFVRDCEARNLAPGTIQGYRTVLRDMERWAAARDLAALADIDGEWVRAWYESWTCRPSTAGMRLTKVKAFFTHAVARGWTHASPAARIKGPRVKSPPTLPLGDDEVRAMLAAAAGKPKERALLLLMRFSGLSIGDACTLRRSALQGKELVLRRAKTGELVTVALPAMVLQALQRLQGPNPRFFWWSGRGQPVTATKYWRTRLGLVAQAAGVDGFRPHRLRDTFAVALLTAGTSMEDVSALLGHRSIRVTEQHYAPWNKARRDRLIRVVEQANGRSRLLAELAREEQEKGEEALQRRPRQERPARSSQAEDRGPRRL